MPLSFRSESHGNIAFGFFNIESDMLLLENYFFFADRFCEWMVESAGRADSGLSGLHCHAYHIADPNDIGDLMGAIHGIRYTGFIGKIYELFPFPEDPKDFKQNPKGNQTQGIVTSEIEAIAGEKEFTIEFFEKDQVQLGPYVFDMSVFHELIRYVWQGGYPRYKEEIKPSYVLKMEKHILESHNRFFKGVFSS